MNHEETIKRIKAKIAKIQQEADEHSHLSTLREMQKDREAEKKLIASDLCNKQRGSEQLHRRKEAEEHAQREQRWREKAEILAESQPTFEDGVRSAVEFEDAQRYQVVPYPDYAERQQVLQFESDTLADMSYSMFRETYNKAQKEQAYCWVKTKTLSDELHHEQLAAIYDYLIEKNMISFR